MKRKKSRGLESGMKRKESTYFGGGMEKKGTCNFGGGTAPKLAPPEPPNRGGRTKRGPRI